jgi:RNA polymerase sigma-70 factor (ECF subfamily)
MGGQVTDLIPALRAFARSLVRNAEEVDDLVQETLMKAIAHIDGFAPGTNLKSWMFTIMRNTFLTNIKRRRRERVGDADCVSYSACVKPDQEWKSMANDVQMALQRLHPDHREVVVLVAMLGTSYEDAAAICGCNIGTIKSRLNRARAKLLENLRLESDWVATKNGPQLVEAFW